MLEKIAAAVRRVLTDRGWELYTRPHLNGLQPDLVPLNPRVGIALYHVSELDAETLSTARAHDLVRMLGVYKTEVLALYCPRLGLRVSEAPGALAVVTTGLIFPRLSTAEAKSLLRPAMDMAKLLGAAEPYTPVSGIDVLERSDAGALLPSANFRSSVHMTREFAADLRAWLHEPDQISASRTELELDDSRRSSPEAAPAPGIAV
jgi:hypothetical protein